MAELLGIIPTYEDLTINLQDFIDDHLDAGLPELLLPKFERRSRLIAAVIKDQLGPKKRVQYRLGDTHDVYLNAIETGSKDRTRHTYAIQRVCAPRERGEKTYSDSVAKIEFYRPVLKKGVTDQDSARVRFYTSERHLEGIHPQEWNIIKQVLQNIQTEYQSLVSGTIKTSKLREYVAKTLLWHHVLSSPYTTGGPRIMAAHRLPELNNTMPLLKSIGVTLDIIEISGAHTMLRKAAQGPLQVAEKRTAAPLQRSTAKREHAQFWVKLDELHSDMETLLGETIPRPYLDATHKKAIQLLK